MSGWTEKAIDILREGTLAGLSNGQMAARIKAETGWTVTRNAVIGKRSRMGIALTPEQVAENNRIAAARASDKAHRRRLAAEQREAAKRALTSEQQRQAAEPERQKMLRLLASGDPFRATETTRPLSTRRMGEECAWPIEDGNRSCCAPVSRGSYCAAHASVGYRAAVSSTDLIRSLRRYA